MRARILSTILVLLVSFACDDDGVYRKTPPVAGDMFNIELCPTLVANAVALFPEARNNAERHSQLFGGTAQQHIVLTRDTDVYVSFVTEAAAIGNVLGYYIYDNGNVPSSAGQIDKQLVFPNVDATYLKPGDTRKLGKEQLKAGTVIGFFLIVGGYRNDGVYFQRPTYYTNHEWNKEESKQHVLYREEECGAVVIGFEDRLSAEADKDYNDIIFMVSDNTSNEENTAFDLQSVVTLTQ